MWLRGSRGETVSRRGEQEDCAQRTGYGYVPTGTKEPQEHEGDKFNRRVREQEWRVGPRFARKGRTALVPAPNPLVFLVIFCPLFSARLRELRVSV